MACCPGHGAAALDVSALVPPAPAEATSTPAWSSGFTELNIRDKLGDGYWIEAFPFRSKIDKDEGPVGPEVIGYGLGYKDANDKLIPSEVRMYRNPFNEMKSQITPPNQWDYTVIKRLDYAVAATYGNFRPESGLNDVIICHNYGPNMDNLNMDGGDVSLLVNPGDKKKEDWQMKHVGRFPAMHRLKTGYFTQKKHVEIMALPIMIKSGDRESPAPVIIYTPTEWDNDKVPSKWQETRPLDNTFRLIHEVQIIHSKTGGLDKALVAGREGISLMWMDEKSKQWRYENVGPGLPQSRKPFNTKNPYWGSGSVATARVGHDSVGYIATCEAFHGNLISVYVKPPGTRPDQIVTNEHWRRFVIDDFGPLKKEEFTGTVHNVVCADIDGSGVESIIVACMGYRK
ncbi:hypothetical protein FS749_001618 [Ceratobasidium sp. UAMH 11750]|nr:hypothetical protein FS749_001618 [Ceratobasidium sp. UAMH 11750]